MDVNEFMGIVIRESRSRLISTDDGKAFYGELTLVFQDGKFIYARRNETVK